MKIGFLFYDLEKKAGIQRSICNLANGFSNSGDEVFLILCEKNKNISYDLNPNIKVYLINQPEVKFTGPFFWGFKFLWAVIFHFRLIKFLSKVKLDFLIDNGTAWGLINFGRFIQTTKVVLYRHFPAQQFPFGKVLYPLIAIFSKVQNVVVLSPKIKKEFLDLGFSKVEYIPNAIPEVLFSYTNNTKQNDEERLNFIAIGRANTPQKGFDLLLEAVSILVKFNRNFNLKIVGPGIENDDQLLELISKNKLEDYVRLLPKSDNIYDLISSSDFLVISSRYEGLPMIALEALALEVPIVSFPVDGVSGIINHGVNGFLLSSFSSNELAEYLLKLILDRNLGFDMAKNCRSSVLNYRIEFIVKKWKKYLEGLSK